MRLTRIQNHGGTTLARVEGSQLVTLPFDGLKDLLAEENWQEAAHAEGEQIPFDETELAQIIESAQIFCVGLNYKSHIQETGRPIPEYPTLFGKLTSTLTGPNADIALTASSSEVDWEVELGVVIGKAARNVSTSQALDYIAGYTVVNDVSMRDWQNRTNQWFQGKNFEASTPVGPYLVSPDEVDHARDLRITCSINGENVQDGRTSDLLFTPAELVSYISQFTTLLPGDLIITGTPGGVGMARTPKRFLQSGEVLTSEIEGIGVLTNRIVSAV
jgi:acylpyruvate hydrolase